MKVAWIKVVMSTQWALNPSEQPGPLLPPSSFPSDNSYIWGRNADEVSHWGGSEDEPATDTTCFHGTDAQLPFFHPTFSLLTLLSLLSPIVDLQKRRTFPHLSLVASAYLFSISLSVFLLQCPSASFYFPLSLLPPPPLSLYHFPCFPAPPPYQTSEPTINAISFWWENKWNSSWEHGSRWWTKVFQWCCFPPYSAAETLAFIRSENPPHILRHTLTLWPFAECGICTS